MAYDVASLTQEIKTRAKDTSLSDSLITSWLQEAQNGVLGHYRLPFLETAITPTLSINDTEYLLPDDLQEILGIKLVSGGQVYIPRLMPYRDFNDRYQSATAATASAPADAALYGRKLFWNCPLNKAYTLTLSYLRRPVELTSTTTVPDIPVEYRELLVRGALQRVEEYRENFDIASLHARKVEDLSEDMLQRYGARQRITTSHSTPGGRRVGLSKREGAWD